MRYIRMVTCTAALAAAVTCIPAHADTRPYDGDERRTQVEIPNGDGYSQPGPGSANSATQQPSGDQNYASTKIGPGSSNDTMDQPGGGAANMNQHAKNQATRADIDVDTSQMSPQSQARGHSKDAGREPPISAMASNSATHDARQRE